jgi:cation diffusion facilitator family transporter
MSTEGSSRAIFAALIANMGIATTKFIAATVSGSASMLAEGIHSLADSGNQILLLVGSKRSKRAASETHPFGFGRSRYLYAFVVSIVLFSVGGLFSIVEGIDKISGEHEIEAPWLPISVLLVAILLESFSLRTALQASKNDRKGISLMRYIREAKSPELPVVVLEDIAALVGLVLAFFGVSLAVLTGNPVFDAIGTIAIGLLLVVVAIILGVETSSLLVGEGAASATNALILEKLQKAPGVKSVIHMKTLYLGPEQLLLGAKIEVASNASGSDIGKTIDEAEALVREAVPELKVIYLEPDVLRK